MAGELSCDTATGLTIYANIRNRTSGYIWNGSAFEAYLAASGNQSSYAISMSEQGAGGHYTGNAPSTMANGVYDATAKKKINAWFAETDQLVANGELHWNGSIAVPLGDLATSGQIGTLSPLRIGRGTMVQNFGIFLKSSSDHLSNFTSGVVSGQIARDAGSFSALQSGTFTETGLGSYVVTLTSGDTLGNTLRLYFSATGISGGTSDTLAMSVITQRTSGQ